MKKRAIKRWISPTVCSPNSPSGRDNPKGIASDVQIAQAICVEIESSIGGLYDSTHPSAMRRMTMVREFYARGSNDHDADKKDAPSAETVAEYLGDTSMLKPSASIEGVWVDHNVVQGGATGMLIHVRFSVKRTTSGSRSTSGSPRPIGFPPGGQPLRRGACANSLVPYTGGAVTRSHSRRRR